MNKSAMQAESWLPWGKSSHALALEMQGCLSAAADGSGHASTLPTMPIPCPPWKRKRAGTAPTQGGASGTGASFANMAASAVCLISSCPP